MILIEFLVGIIANFSDQRQSRRWKIIRGLKAKVPPWYALKRGVAEIVNAK